MKHRGFSLVVMLFIFLVIFMVLPAILMLTTSNWRLANTDKSRASALSAAEAGLNWEIGRINNRRYNLKDDGTLASPAVDLWPDNTTTPPSTVSTVALDGTTQFKVGTSADPFTVPAGMSFVITAEGQVRESDGHIIRRRVSINGGGLASLFDTMAIFAFGSWNVSGSNTINGGAGSNGPINSGSNTTLNSGPLWIWGAPSIHSGDTLPSGTYNTIRNPSLFVSDDADLAATNFYPKSESATGAGISMWKPTISGPTDSYNRAVNTQAQLINTSTGAFINTVLPADFNNKKGNPVLDNKVKGFGSGTTLLLRPGVYYFTNISLGSSDIVKVANDYYKANGTALYDATNTAINGPAAVADYNNEINRITVFVDGDGTNSGISSGLYTALYGDKSAINSLTYRRPGNFRIYAKNAGTFTVKGSSSSTNEFNANILYYYKDSSGNYKGDISLASGCVLRGGLFAWNVIMSGGATVSQAGGGVFGTTDVVYVAPVAGNWGWDELAFQ